MHYAEAHNLVRSVWIIKIKFNSKINPVRTTFHLLIYFSYKVYKYLEVGSIPGLVLYNLFNG